MPRKPKFNHPLRLIRKAAGLTQEQFAKLVGVSKDTIQSVENGRLDLSGELAIKIQHQTGCSLSHGLPKNEGNVNYGISAYSASTLRPYTAQDYREHRDSLKEFDEKDFEERVIATARCMDLLLRSALRQSGGTVSAILTDFEQFASKTFTMYRLNSNMKGVLSEAWGDVIEAEKIDRYIRTFPHAPLSTAWAFQAPFEDPENWKK